MAVAIRVIVGEAEEVAIEVMGESQNRWQMVSWRIVCFLSVLFLHAWVISSPLEKTAASEVAYSEQTKAVSLSFYASSAEQAIPVVKSKENTIEKPLAHKEPVILEKEQPKPAITHQPQIEISTKAPIKIQQKVAQIDTQAAVFKQSASTNKKVVSAVTNNPLQSEASTKVEAKTETLASVATIQRNQNDIGIHHVPVVTEPLFTKPPTPPKYPTIARKRGQHGTVWLEIWLDDQGQQSKLSIMQSSGVDVLDRAALKAVAGWHFQPYIVNGAGAVSRVQIPVEFALN